MPHRTPNLFGWVACVQRKQIELTVSSFRIHSRLQKSRFSFFFFLKISKEIGKAWRKSLTGAKRRSRPLVWLLACIWIYAKIRTVLQSRSIGIWINSNKYCLFSLTLSRVVNKLIASENIRFSTLFAAGDVSRGGMSVPPRETSSAAKSEEKWMFSQANKPSDVQGGAVRREHFETSLVMVSCHGYKMWSHK